ncbi:proton-coupled amino acid transporter-like protein CG1139 [Euwallacea similis]|uniref:proton-coupled amino acid transporter-like protein CG1139 n=1 Tax=Euwallacea similis TaxID=1736056 RepID=UPI00344B9E64
MEVAEKTKDPGLATDLNNFNSTWTLIKHQDGHFSVASSREEITSDITYNPYEHRQVAHPNGFLGAFLHIVKTSLGTGILAIPRAFKSAGLLVGLIGTLLVGLTCTHAIHILVKASQKVCRQTRTPSLGFADTAEGVFKLGPKGLRKYSRFAKIFVEASLFLVHFLADAVYLVFISISLIKLFSAYFPIVNTWDSYIFKLILLVPLLIFGQVRELKHLVPFSFIANLMLLITFSTTGYYLFSGIEQVDIKERNLVTTISGIPSFFSTVLFSMEGIGTIMPVENSMVAPGFIGRCGVLNSAMTIIITLYTTIGFFGYYRFGEATEATITANLPTDEIPAEVAQGAIAIAVFFSFMLVFYVPVDIVWSNIKDKIPKSKWNISQIILRCTMISIATGIAIAGGQNLGQLIDLVGAIFLSTLGLFIPAFLDVIVDWHDGWGVYNWRLFKDFAMMALALFGLVSGVFYAIKDIIG